MGDPMLARFVRSAAAAVLVALGVRAVLIWRQGRQAGEAPFEGLRLAMNDHVNPWLMDRGFAGGRRGEIAMIEHVGRRSGELHRTPVAPTFTGDDVWIPLPYGEASQWARNVIATGQCRLQVRGSVYHLDEPGIVRASDNPQLPPAVARTLDWLGIEFLRLHRFSEHAGTLDEPGVAPVVTEKAEALPAA
jgi:deazaflavin-dependent oxidoreductase (nitroreductase family)